MTTLSLGDNQLTSLTLPAGLTRLTGLYLAGNPLKSLTLGPGLTSLIELYLGSLGLTNLALAEGLTSLTTLDLSNNQLSSLTLPAGLTNLTTLYLDGNPLTTLALPKPLAVTGLADTVGFLKDQGVSIYSYPLAVSLVSPQGTAAGAFGFTLIGPPAAYTILSSTDLAAWNELGTLTNALGAALFTDVEANNSSQKFYRATVTLP